MITTAATAATTATTATTATLMFMITLTLTILILLQAVANMIIFTDNTIHTSMITIMTIIMEATLSIHILTTSLVVIQDTLHMIHTIIQTPTTVAVTLISQNMTPLLSMEISSFLPNTIPLSRSQK